MGPIAHNSQHDDVNNGIIDLKLDVYEPVNAPANRPAVLIIHGGGFSGGARDKDVYVDFANFFAERGFVAVSISYRLLRHKGTVPESWFNLFDDIEDPSQRDQGLAMYPAARDAKTALRWLHANAATYKINPNYITTLGGSAGSHLAIMLGVTNAADFRDELTDEDDPTLTSTNMDAAVSVHTIINHWGSKIIVDVIQALDGMDRFDETDAPISIVHGLADDIVLPIEGEKLETEYTRTGVPHEAHYLPDRGHGVWGARLSIDGIELSLRDLAFQFIIEQQELRLAP
jgi:acetyl esterase/lipase